MIRNQWYVVLDSGQVKDRPVGVTRMGEKLVFWRDAQRQVACLFDRCAHRKAQLSLGQVVEGGKLQCPFHGFEYDGRGRVTAIPANGRSTPVPERFRVQSYPVHEAHGFIWIWWGEKPPADLQPPAFFADIGPELSYGQARDHWRTHYSRVIENQLDVVHLPFVHRTTIGRGNRALVDGPVLRWVNENAFEVYPYNRRDDGTPPRRAEELPPDENRVKLEFLFPNLWQNHISEKVRVLAAFVPVDEENTVLYLRFYQSFLRLPGLKQALNALAMPFNLLVAHQDRRVVETQHPKPSALQGGELLVPGDRPVVEYRRRRQALLEATEKAL